MKLSSFLAEDANSALTQIYEKLGPDAVVVSVRKLPGEGILGLRQKGRKVEVTACVPDESPKPQVKIVPTAIETFKPAEVKIKDEPAPTRSRGHWRKAYRVEAMLLPLLTDRLERKTGTSVHDEQPMTHETEWIAVGNMLTHSWRPARQMMAGTGRPHVFIGPAGSGKTTALCKWMTSEVLANQHSVRVWRLDGETANASEFLTLHCELLGVPLERFWSQPKAPADLHFVDLPGAEIQNTRAIAALRDQLATLPQPHIHLVLNAANESSILFDHFQAFESFAPEDIIFTHLDEEPRREKIWNFVLGTNCPISFLGAGQKIPGEFRRAEPALLFPYKNDNKS